MGRAGITLHEVEKAALELQGRGKNPTVDAVRALLGTGSKSTIITHLKAWKAKHVAPSGQLPEELYALVTGLWERLNQQADARIEAIENEMSLQITTLQQDLSSLTQAKNELNEQFQSETVKLKSETEKRLIHEKALQKLSIEQDKLLAKEKLQLQQMAEQKKEQLRLHQLAANLQKNLEHYQETMQTVKTELNLALENERSEFKATLAQYQHEIDKLKQLNKAHEPSLLTKELEIKQYRHEANKMDNLILELKRKVDSQSKELIIAQDRYDQFKRVNTNMQASIEATQKKLGILEAKLSFSEQQEAIVQKRCKALEDKLESLQDKNAFLSHEKAHLQKCLEKFEKQLETHSTKKKSNK